MNNPWIVFYTINLRYIIPLIINHGSTTIMVYSYILSMIFSHHSWYVVSFSHEYSTFFSHPCFLLSNHDFPWFSHKIVMIFPWIFQDFPMNVPLPSRPEFTICTAVSRSRPLASNAAIVASAWLWKWLGKWVGKWWDNDGIMMGQWWENDGTMGGRMGGRMMGKWWENDKKMMGKSWDHLVEQLQILM